MRPPHLVYNTRNTLESLCQPSLTPITWGHISLYHDFPNANPDPDHKLKIPPDNIRQFARTCRDGGIVVNRWQPGGWPVVAGAPVVLDFETILSDPKDVPVFAEYVRVFKAEAPGVPVSVLWVQGTFAGDMLNAFARGLTAEEAAKMDAAFALVEPITSQLDFITGGAYLSTAPQRARDLIAGRAANDFTKSRFPAKPLYFFVSPRWEWAPGYPPLDAGAAQDALDLARRYDATVLWAPEWEDKAGGTGIKDVFLPLVKKAK